MQSTELKNPAALDGAITAHHKHSRAPRILLYIMFLVLMIDLMPNLGIGFGTGISAKNLFSYFFLVFIAVRAAMRPSGMKLVDLDVHVPYLLMMAYAAATWAIAATFDPTYSALRGAVTYKNQLIDLYLFLIAFRYGVERKEDYLWLFRAIVITLMVSSVVTLIDFFNIPDLGIIGEHKGRLEGPVGAANQYGALLAFLIPVSISIIPRNAGPAGYWGWRLGILVMVALLVATGSRGAFVAAILGSVAAILYLRDFLNMRLVGGYVVAFLVLSVVVVIAVYFANPELISERFTKTTTGTLDTASSGRISIWRAAVLVMYEWPLSFIVGYGWNSFEASGIWKSAHNEYLDRWFELGIPGLLAYVYLLYVLVARARRALRSCSPELGRMLIGYVFGMLIIVVNIFFVAIPDPWTVIWIVTGLIMGLQALEQKEAGRIERMLDPAATPDR